MRQATLEAVKSTCVLENCVIPTLGALDVSCLCNAYKFHIQAVDCPAQCMPLYTSSTYVCILFKTIAAVF